MAELPLDPMAFVARYASGGPPIINYEQSENELRKLTDVNGILALDESTSGNFVTAGAPYIQKQNLELCLKAFSIAKSDYGIADDAEVHCRVLFAGDNRRKSSFSELKPEDLIPFLLHCIKLTSQSGCRWFGCHCDMSTYPQKLQLSHQDGGQVFSVTNKHVASFVAWTCYFMSQNFVGRDFGLIFDKDSTKIDWG